MNGHSTVHAIAFMLMQVDLRMNEVLSLDVMHASMHVCKNGWMKSDSRCRCALLHPS